MKPPPLVRAVADYCSACRKAGCDACVFRDYREDILSELARRRRIAKAKAQMIQSVALRTAGLGFQEVDRVIH